MVYQNKLIPIVKPIFNDKSTKNVSKNLSKSQKPSEKIDLKEQKRKAILQSIQQKIKSFHKFEELSFPKSKKINY